MNITALLCIRALCAKPGRVTSMLEEQADLSKAAQMLSDTNDKVLKSYINIKRKHSDDFALWKCAHQLSKEYFKVAFTNRSKELETSLGKLCNAQDRLVRNSTYRRLRTRKGTVLDSMKKVASEIEEIKNGRTRLEGEMRVLDNCWGVALEYPITENINKCYAEVIKIVRVLAARKSAFDDARDALRAKDNGDTDISHYSVIENECNDIIKGLMQFTKDLRHNHGLSIIVSEHMPLAVEIYKTALDELDGVYGRVIGSCKKYISDVGISASMPVLDPQFLMELEYVKCVLESAYDKWVCIYDKQANDLEQLFNDIRCYGVF